MTKVQFTEIHTVDGPITGVPVTLEAMAKVWDADLIRICTRLKQQTVSGLFSDIEVADLKTMNRESLESALIEVAGFFDCTQYETSDAVISKLSA